MIYTRRHAVLLMISAIFTVLGTLSLAQAQASSFNGRYFGSQGKILHTWDFNSDGSFLHTTIASGSGTHVRNSEKGRFHLTDGYIELSVTSAAGGYTTPGTGGRDTLVGGDHETKKEIRRLKIEILGANEGIVLDGIKMKVKSW